MDINSGSNPPSEQEITQLRDELVALRAEMISNAEQAQADLNRVHETFRASAENLLHYLALRRRDLRPLQMRLAALGLSSLGRAEAHVLATVDAVLQVLNHLADHTGQLNCSPLRSLRSDDSLPQTSQASGALPDKVGFDDGRRLLAEHADALLGVASPGRSVRIMVTMPGEAASDYALVASLLQQGMNCMRINCAHDDRSVWLQIIEHLRRAEQSLGRSCRVVMDLAGPKLRTGPLTPGPAVVRIRPRRNVLGQVTTPARIWLTSDQAALPAPAPADAVLPLPAAWLDRLQTGERLKLTDSRGSRRSLTVVDVSAAGVWAEARQTIYCVPGTRLVRRRQFAENQDREAAVGALPATESALLLRQGDRLQITRDLAPGRPAVLDSAGQLLSPASIGCTIPEVFDDVRPGEPIWFDDGRIGGVVETVERAAVLVRITRVRVRGEKLRGDKGINLPESKLRLASLTPQDFEDLAFVAEHADVVEMSFANTPEDVESLQQELLQRNGQAPAIVLKIETQRGFRNLPEMLLTAMRGPCCGVMIARGDLAVECGFERLAEVQEEILWICEAAHVPVIWATQVLETLAKEGLPSRAEITDAAMGDRAECVMLNKGPHIVTAVRVLDDILRRMQAHQTKKRSMLRELHLAQPR